jgi:glutathione S-transferase
MKLYYAKGACSLAPHIALEEAGAAHALVPVDLRSKRYEGGDYTQINPKGSVPALQIDGQVLTEAQVILQYVADQHPEARLLPKAGTFERYRALEMLNYIATELHKGFGPLWYEATPEEFKEVTKQTLAKRFDYLTRQLEGKEYLLGAFSVADAYLFTVLNWTNFLSMDLGRWPALTAYVARVKNRPAVQRALAAEGFGK